MPVFLYVCKDKMISFENANILLHTFLAPNIRQVIIYILVVAILLLVLIIIVIILKVNNHSFKFYFVSM